MKYRRMKFTKILQELDSEEKARIWVWAAKFDGKNFLCPKCQHEEFYQHKKSPEVRECKNCHFDVRLRANTIFQHSKTPMFLVKSQSIFYLKQKENCVPAFPGGLI